MIAQTRPGGDYGAGIFRLLAEAGGTVALTEP